MEINKGAGIGNKRPRRTIGKELSLMAEKRVCRSVLLKQMANQPITGQELNHCSEDNLLKVKASFRTRKEGFK